MPCPEPKVFGSNQDLNLDNDVFNIISGSTINISNNVSLNNSDQLTLIATDEIILESGFYAEGGSDFNTVIVDNFCFDTGMITPENDDKFDKDIESSMLSLKEEVSYLNYKIYPNPNTGNFKIMNLNEEISYKITLFNVSGSLISDNDIIGLNEFTINSIESGIYLLKIIDMSTGRSEQHKVIISK